jgi:hypothetical protein
MSSGRIPSGAELRTIITQASRYIKHTRRLLKLYPEGRAPHGKTDARDICLDELSKALDDPGVVAPFGWPEAVVRALQKVVRLAGNLRSWFGYGSWISLSPGGGSYFPEDEFDPVLERQALAEFEAAVKTLEAEFEAAVKTLERVLSAEAESADVAIPPPRQPADDSGTEAPYTQRDLVTLSQAAAMVHKTKRALEHYKSSGELPDPAVDGGGGQAALYDWKILGPWLQSKFGIVQPPTFPANRRNT